MEGIRLEGRHERRMKTRGARKSRDTKNKDEREGEGLKELKKKVERKNIESCKIDRTRVIATVVVVLKLC